MNLRRFFRLPATHPSTWDPARRHGYAMALATLVTLAFLAVMTLAAGCAKTPVIRYIPPEPPAQSGG